MQPNLRKFRTYILNPIRLSGLIALFFLVLPGSLIGVSLLFSYAGMGFPMTAMPSHLHAMFQLVGYFMILIWGFLAHGFPGMLGGSHESTKTIHRPLLALAIVLGLVWLDQWLRTPTAVRWVLWTSGFLCSLWVTRQLAAVMPSAKRQWKQVPLPFLIFPLMLMPVYWPLLAASQAGFLQSVVVSDLLLSGIILPIILTMAYRMLSAMVGLAYPRERWFITASLLWAAGVALMPVSAGFGPLAPVTSLLMFAGAAGFVISLGVFLPHRRQGRRAQAQPIDQALLLYVRVSFVFFLAGQGLHLLATSGALPGIEHYWTDVARHYIAVGFGFLLVAGITQRVLPTFLRGRRSSPGWMKLNLSLIVVGLLLRLGEPFLPETRILVLVSAAMLYAGILGYAVHLLRGMLVPSKEELHPMERIRKAPPSVRSHP